MNENNDEDDKSIVNWNKYEIHVNALIKIQTQPDLSLLETTSLLNTLNAAYMLLATLDDYTNYPSPLFFNDESNSTDNDNLKLLEKRSIELRIYTIMWDELWLGGGNSFNYIDRTGKFKSESARNNLKKSSLLIKSMHINSPGVWEFLGKLNPLESLRKYLCEKHERRKDVQYRNRLEEEQLELANDLKRFEILNAAIETMNKAGAPKDTIRDTIIKPCRYVLKNINADAVDKIQYIELKEKRITDESVKKPPA